MPWYKMRNPTSRFSGAVIIRRAVGFHSNSFQGSSDSSMGALASA